MNNPLADSIYKRGTQSGVSMRKAIAEGISEIAHRCAEIAKAEAAEWGDRADGEDGFTAAVCVAYAIEKEFGLTTPQSETGEGN